MSRTTPPAELVGVRRGSRYSERHNRTVGPDQTIFTSSSTPRTTTFERSGPKPRRPRQARWSLSTTPPPSLTPGTLPRWRFLLRRRHRHPLSIRSYPPTMDVANTVMSPMLTTSAPGELVCVFVGADGTGNTVTSVTGGGLTFARATGENGPTGDAEVWWAWAPAMLTNAQVTVVNALVSDVDLDVVTFTGALSTGPIGAAAYASADTGTPTVSLTTTGSNSWVFGAGADTGSTNPRTLGAGQTMVDEASDGQWGSDWWVQRQTATTPSAGTLVTINDTARTTDVWDLATVEILPAAVTVAPGSLAPITAPTNGAGSAGRQAAYRWR